MVVFVFDVYHIVVSSAVVPALLQPPAKLLYVTHSCHPLP